MILSNLFNNKQQLNKLVLLKLRNQVSELRQVQNDLSDYISDERRIIEDFHDQIGLKMEDFVNLFKSKAMQASKNIDSKDHQKQVE